ncbi:50S ribosomal protein L25 [Candidatus Beckwithbacteria bacterium]|nr:50S ribosomal protein L25 [Candidatus Beckwithbacteria bacterium]
MAVKLNLNAQKREVFGRKVKNLRKEGKVPANIYGTKVKSQAITLDITEFKQVFKEAGETTIINIQIDDEKETRPILVHEVQVHPVDRQVLHIDLRQVDLKQKIKAFVGIELMGESPAQALGGVVITLKDELEVEALPTDLPENFTIDISKLKEIGDTILVKDLEYDKEKVQILAEADEALVKAEEPQKEEPEEAPAPVEGEATAEGETTETKEEKTEEAAKEA